MNHKNFFSKKNGFEVFGIDCNNFYHNVGVGIFDIMSKRKKVQLTVDDLYLFLLKQFRLHLYYQGKEIKKKKISIRNISTAKVDIEWAMNIENLVDNCYTHCFEEVITKIFKPISDNLFNSIYAIGIAFDSSCNYSKSEIMPQQSFVSIDGKQEEWNELLARLNIMRMFDCQSWIDKIKMSLSQKTTFSYVDFFKTFFLYGLNTRGKIKIIDDIRNFNISRDSYSLSKIPFYWEYLGESYSMAIISGNIGIKDDGRFSFVRGWGLREDVPL